MFDILKDIVDKGELLFAEGKMDEAEACFLSIIRNGFNLSEILNNLGVIFFQKKDLETSSNYFKQALDMDPLYRPALINYFEIHKFSVGLQVIMPVIKNFLIKHPDDKEIEAIYLDALNINCKNSKNNVSQNELFPNTALLNIKKLRDANQEEREQVQRINNLIKSLNQSEYLTNKPHRNLIITGIPGSGIDIFLNILRCIENTACYGDMTVDADSLPKVYANLRKILTEINSGNKLKGYYPYIPSDSISPSHTLHNNFDTGKAYDEDVVVGLKQNLAYMKLNAMQGARQNELEILFNTYGYNTVAIIKDPVQTIANWNSKCFANSPESMVTDDNLSSRWKGIRFTSKNKIERQAQIWEFYAQFFVHLNSVIKIYTYEQISAQFDQVIKDVCHFLTLPIPKNISQLRPTDKNLFTDELNEISAAVKKHCPTRLNFCYRDKMADNDFPAIWDDYSVFTGTHAKVIDFESWTGGLVFKS